MVPPGGLDRAGRIAWVTEREMRLARRLLEAFPDEDDALVVMGNVYRTLGDTERAAEYWNRALAVNPRRVNAYDGLAMIAMEKGLHEEAAGYWERALAIDPGYPGLRTNLAQAWIRAGQHDRAVAILEEQLRARPTATAYFFLGQEQLRRGQFEAARASYASAVRLKPDYVGAYHGLMTACVRLGRVDEAREHEATFRRLKAADVRQMVDRNRRLDDVEEVCQKAAETALAAVRLYERAGDTASARAYLSQAERLAGDDTYCLERVAVGRRRQGDLAGVLRVRQRIARLAPEDAMNLYNLGGLLMEMRRVAEAVAVLERVVRLSPDFAGGHRELARAYLLLGRRSAKALASARRAVSLEPSGMNYYVLSWAWDKNGNKAEAMAALRRAMELDPANPMIRKRYEMAIYAD